MKSLPASLALAAAAIIQAMGLYKWHPDSMAVAGQVFFPVLFGLMSVYLAWRNKGSERFFLAHTIVMVLGILALVATLIGVVGTVFALYPSYIVYYVCLLVIVIETALRIAAMPKKKKAEPDSENGEVRKPKRRRKVAGAGPTNLVAKPKNQSSPEDSEKPQG
ncbi:MULTISPECIES: hypothetical protein [Micrococcaceae]|uniref:hypothetical protein n=1 Tax=unclassified Kocuria TaxID=2649579 RepID=UPI0010136DE2|nr:MULTISPECIES: hypothetical protein [unclassified Kocuria]